MSYGLAGLSDQKRHLICDHFPVTIVIFQASHKSFKRSDYYERFYFFSVKRRLMRRMYPPLLRDLPNILLANPLMGGYIRDYGAVGHLA